MQRRLVTLLQALLFLSATAAALALYGPRGGISERQWASIATLLWGARLLLFLVLRLDRSRWRFFGFPDAFALSLIATVGPLSALVQGVFLPGAALPYPFVVSEWLLCLVFTLTPRAAWRLHFLRRGGRRAPAHRRVLLYAPPDEAAKIVRELRDYPELGIEVAGLLIEGARWRESAVELIPVLGDADAIPTLVDAHAIDEVLTAPGSAAAGQRARLMEMCRFAAVPLRFVDTLPQRMRATSWPLNLPELTVERFLGGSASPLSGALLARAAEAAFVVTGAGSETGIALLRLLLEAKAKRVVAVDSSPAALSHCRDILRRELPAGEVEFRLEHPDAYRSAGQLLSSGEFDALFLLAPTLDDPIVLPSLTAALHPALLAPRQWAAAARTAGVPVVIFASGLRAGAPEDAAGAVLRAREMALLTLAGAGMAVRGVRLSPVLETAQGLFEDLREQIAQGGPVRIAHPDQGNWFVSPAQAAARLLEALARPEPAAIWEPRRGEPVAVADLARAMIHAAGAEPDLEIGLVFRGFEAGETVPLAHSPQPVEERVWNPEEILLEDAAEWASLWDEIARCAREGDTAGCIQTLQTLAPAFRPPAQVWAAAPGTAALRRILTQQAPAEAAPSAAKENEQNTEWERSRKPRSGNQ